MGIRPGRVSARSRGSWTTLISASLCAALSLTFAPAAFAAPDPGDAELVGASDNRMLIFFETRERITEADTDNESDVYMHDQFGGSPSSNSTLLSATPTGGNANFNGRFAADYVGNSADGSLVWFETIEPLLPEDVDFNTDVYQYSAADESVSILTAGPPSECNQECPAEFEGAAPDGSTVYFSTRENLVETDQDNEHDIYASQGGVLSQVSTGPDGGNAAFEPSFRDARNGETAFFVTDESLVAADADDERRDVYRWDAGTTTLVSAGLGSDWVHGSEYLGASQDGSRVFVQTASPLDGADSDIGEDIFQRMGSTTTLISTGPTTSGDATPTFGGVSEDGLDVIFQTSDSLVAGDGDSHADVYRRRGSATTLLSTGAPSGYVHFGAMSADASHVFFETSVQLDGADVDASQDIYDWTEGGIALASLGPDGGNDEHHAWANVASTSGNTIVFDTSESLVSADTDANQDGYVHRNGSTQLVTTGPTDPHAGAFPECCLVSPGGNWVLFTHESPVTDEDSDAEGDLDVFVFYPDAPALALLVSRELVPPKITISPDLGATGDTTPTLTFAVSEPGEYTCEVYPLLPEEPCSGPGASHTVADPLFERTHRFFVGGYDLNGNRAVTKFSEFTVDLGPPITYLDGGPSEGSLSSDTTADFSFYASENDVTFQCELDGGETNCTQPLSGAHTTYPLPDGTHTFSVRSVDDAHNFSPWVTRNFTIDGTGPVTNLDDGPDRVTTNRTPTFSFSSDDPSASFECSTDDGPFAGCSGAGQHTTEPLADGSHVFSVRATDPAGNVDPSPVRFRFTVVEPPPDTAAKKPCKRGKKRVKAKCVKRGKRRK
jgi:hypothetical protein